MIQAVVARVVTSTLAAVLTERFVMNVLVLLASWLASKTKNDLDDQLVEALKDALDKDHGRPRNLYDEIRKKD